MTLHEHVTAAGHRLLDAGIAGSEARLDAELLAREVLGWDRARFLANRYDEAPQGFDRGYERLVSRRERREPISYITGVREFWGLPFEVTPDVLIPRHETELIVEEALIRLRAAHARSSAARSLEPSYIVDAGTGSGCLAVALALECPTARIVATDISPAALAVARRNAGRHGVSARIEFQEASFLDLIDGRPDLIVSNPPYVPARVTRSLAPELQRYEPAIALFSGADGLMSIRALLRQALGVLSAEGWLIFEFGDGQEEEVRDLIASDPRWDMVRIRPDLQGIPRAAVVRKRMPVGEILTWPTVFSAR